MLLKGKILKIETYKGREGLDFFALTVKEPNPKWADKVYRVMTEKKGYKEGQEVEINVDVRAELYTKEGKVPRPTLRVSEIQ